MKKKIGFLIVILLIFIIVLTIFIVSKKNIVGNDAQEGKSDPIILEDKNKLTYIDNRPDAFLLENLVKRYINYIVDEDKTKVIDILPTNILEENNITENNVLEFAKDKQVKYSQNYDIIIDEIYVLRENFEKENYLIKINYFNLDNKTKYKTNIIIQLDRINETFQILPSEYLKDKGYDKLKIGDSFNIEIPDIQAKKYNTYKLTPVGMDVIVQKYFETFLLYVQYDLEDSYNLLDEEYKEKRFGDVSNYKKYLETVKLNETYITKYKADEYDNYTQITCIDQNNNYYILKEIAPMKYKVILDRYTIDIPEFIEKYNNSNDLEKASLDIEKVFEAINHKDYKYVYDKLDSKYKENNFKTLEEFEKYAKEQFFEINKISAKNPEQKTDICIYDIEIEDETGNNKKEKSFAIKLKDGTDFSMSFNI